MKLSISNIAWPEEKDAEVYQLLSQYDVGAIEVAPTRIWPNWVYSPDQVQTAKAELAAQGLQVSSFQAIIYGCPDLKVFGTPSEKQALVNHLKRVADLAVQLGAGPMVFGAPKNRDRGDRTAAEAMIEAADLFAEVGEYCTAVGTCLCLEPNPKDYNCTFVTDSKTGAELVRSVNSPGFRLHLDVAGMFLAGESIPHALDAAADVLAHVHISEPYLGSFNTPQINHAEVAAGLKSINWDNWVSIEMRATDQPVAAVERALQFVQATYPLT